MLRTTIYQAGESQDGPTSGLRNQTETQDFEALENAREEIAVITEKAFLFEFLQGCIILELCLTDQEGVDYYSDPANQKSYANKIKDILRAKRREKGRPVDDIDDMVITFSEKDIKEAREFFALGKEDNKKIIS